MERKNLSSSAIWEPIVGYSRAVRMGPFVAVSGTTAFDALGKIVGVGDAAAQTRQIIDNLRRALAGVGARLEDVVRTRIFVTNIDEWQTIGRVHGEAFGAIRPATTMVEVRRLISPEILLEIEADAVVAGGAEGVGATMVTD